MKHEQWPFEKEFPGRPLGIFFRLPNHDMVNVRYDDIPEWCRKEDFPKLAAYTNTKVYTAVENAKWDYGQMQKRLEVLQEDNDYAVKRIAELLKEVKRLKRMCEPEPQRELTAEQEEHLDDSYDIRRELTPDLGDLPF